MIFLKITISKEKIIPKSGENVTKYNGIKSFQIRNCHQRNISI